MDVVLSIRGAFTWYRLARRHGISAYRAYRDARRLCGGRLIGGGV